MDYYSKYIKYKQKYLLLSSKYQIGGSGYKTTTTINDYKKITWYKQSCYFSAAMWFLWTLIPFREFIYKYLGSEDGFLAIKELFDEFNNDTKSEPVNIELIYPRVQNYFFTKEETVYQKDGNGKIMKDKNGNNIILGYEKPAFGSQLSSGELINNILDMTNNEDLLNKIRLKLNSTTKCINGEKEERPTQDLPITCTLVTDNINIFNEKTEKKNFKRCNDIKTKPNGIEITKIDLLNDSNEYFIVEYTSPKKYSEIKEINYKDKTFKIKSIVSHLGDEVGKSGHYKYYVFDDNGLNPFVLDDDEKQKEMYNEELDNILINSVVLYKLSNVKKEAEDKTAEEAAKEAAKKAEEAEAAKKAEEAEAAKKAEEAEAAKKAAEKAEAAKKAAEEAEAEEAEEAKRKAEEAEANRKAEEAKRKAEEANELLKQYNSFFNNYNKMKWGNYDNEDNSENDENDFIKNRIKSAENLNNNIQKYNNNIYNKITLINIDNLKKLKSSDNLEKNLNELKNIKKGIEQEVKRTTEEEAAKRKAEEDRKAAEAAALIKAEAAKKEAEEAEEAKKAEAEAAEEAAKKADKEAEADKAEADKAEADKAAADKAAEAEAEADKEEGEVVETKRKADAGASAESVNNFFNDIYENVSEEIVEKIVKSKKNIPKVSYGIQLPISYGFNSYGSQMKYDIGQLESNIEISDKK